MGKQSKMFLNGGETWGETVYIPTAEPAPSFVWSTRERCRKRLASVGGVERRESDACTAKNLAGQGVSAHASVAVLTTGRCSTGLERALLHLDGRN